MFEIRLEHIGRRFNRDWIFRQLDYSFVSGSRYAVLGPNGSGKSTLMRIVSGSLTSSEGTVTYHQDGKVIAPEHVYRQLSIAAPYMELIEEFTLREMMSFHFSHKSILEGYGADTVAEYIGLRSSMDKALRFFSSGMKQRVKLALACFAKSEILLLDEPIVNLDAQAVNWYHRLLSDTVGSRLLIIASNQEEEYKICGERLHLG